MTTIGDHLSKFDPDRDIPSFTTAQQAPPLSLALSRVEREVAQQEKLIGILSERLTPVRRVEPRAEGQDKSPKRGHSSVIVGQVDEHADHLAENNRRLQVLLEELEV